MKATLLLIVTNGMLLAVSEPWCEAATPEDAPVRLRQQTILKGEEDLWPNSLVFSPDGKILASIEVKRIRLWAVATGNCIATLRHQARQVAFSPNGKILASCARTIMLWDVASHKKLATLWGDASVRWMVFSHDGKNLIAMEHGWMSADRVENRPRQLVEKKRLTMWSVEKQEELRSREMTYDPGLVFVYPTMKKPVFAVSHRNHLGFTLVDALTGKTALSCKGHDRPIICFALDREEKTIVSADELAVRLWSRETGENIATIEHLPDTIFSPALRPNGRNIACALNPDGKILACAYEYQIPNGPRGGGLRLFEIPGGKLLTDMPQEGIITSLVFSPDGRLLVTGVGRDIDLWTVPAAWRKAKK